MAPNRCGLYLAIDNLAIGFDILNASVWNPLDSVVLYCEFSGLQLYVIFSWVWLSLDSPRRGYCYNCYNLLISFCLPCVSIGVLY
jgi:hypothetical protein